MNSVRWLMHEYLGGYQQPSWTIVDEIGQPVRKDSVTLCFSDKSKALAYCEKMNKEYAEKEQ